MNFNDLKSSYYEYIHMNSNGIGQNLDTNDTNKEINI